MEEEKEFDNNTRPVPLWLPISGAVILLLGIFVAPMITNSYSEEQLNRNAILSGFQFLLIFIAIIIFYASIIWFLAYKLNGRVPNKIYRIIEYALIGGIILGIIGMFQPWIFAAFRYGFYLLLAATIGYIAWSHISPAPPEDDTAAILGTAE
ncbi:MAG: YIP1 family protein [Candidatus Promineifilaceae bacterium]|jgi:hypothetical protein